MRGAENIAKKDKIGGVGYFWCWGKRILQKIRIFATRRIYEKNNFASPFLGYSSCYLNELAQK